MKYAVVTGGTKGIGAGIVSSLLSKGYYVFTNYSSDIENAIYALNQFKKISHNIEVIKASQSSIDEFSKFIAHIKNNSTQIDCIICNAGATIRKSNMEITNNEWENVIQVILNSHYYLIRDLYPLIANNSRIIFIGSMMGILPHGTSLPYGVAKSAVHALAKNLVKEFEGTGTTVNAIAPGFVETEWQKNKPLQIRENINNKTALKRFASIDEITSIVNLCLDNQFINGSLIEVNGGYCFK